MSLLDPIDELMARCDRVMELLQEREELIFELLGTASANRVVTKRNLPQLICEAIANPISALLSRYKGYEVVSLDCRGLKKGDAYGWMARVAKAVEETPNMIVIIENLAEIPEGSQCDNPQYVENLLGHSWKNDKIFFGEYMINTSNLTVILTFAPKYAEELGVKFRTDSYSWIPDFDEKLEHIEKELNSLK